MDKHTKATFLSQILHNEVLSYTVYSWITTDVNMWLRRDVSSLWDLVVLQEWMRSESHHKFFSKGFSLHWNQRRANIYTYVYIQLQNTWRKGRNAEAAMKRWGTEVELHYSHTCPCACLQLTTLEMYTGINIINYKLRRGMCFMATTAVVDCVTNVKISVTGIWNLACWFSTNTTHQQ